MLYFSLTKVTPDSVEGISCPDGGLNPSTYGSIAGTPVLLADKVVGSVSGVDINSKVGAAVIKVRVDDLNARQMANSGSLTAVEFDPSTKSVRLRDYVARKAAGTFELVTPNGGRLAKAFKHEMTADDRDSDLRLMHDLERSVYREPRSNQRFSKQFHSAPIDYSKFRKPGKDLIQNANARGTSNSQFGPATGVLPNHNQLAYDIAQRNLAHPGAEVPPYEPAPARATNAPRYIFPRNDTGVGRQ